MSSLAAAIVAEDWRAAAVCLLLGLVTAMSALPADAVAGLVDVVDGGSDADKAKDGRRRRR